MAKLDDLEAKVEGERTRLVHALRSLADRVEALPLNKVTEGLGFLAMSAEAMMQWADRMFGGGGTSGGPNRPT